MKLGRYYIDLNRKLGEDFSEYEFDHAGVPLTRFHRKPDWKHNPITVCQYGLHHFNRFVDEQREASREIFLTQANWLVDHAEEMTEGLVVWKYQFDIPSYKIFAPWISGMAQGQAISALLRAYYLTKDKKYLNPVKGAWNIFQLPVNNGGVISHFPDGRPVIEEYPSPDGLVGVLNGFIFAIFGIYDYAIHTDEKKDFQFCSQFIDSLVHNLHRYDCGFWSYYDLKPPLRMASKPYHRIHIEQLNQLYLLTGQPIFQKFRDRWKGYLSSRSANLKWLIRKIHHKVFLE
jgi:hypothetical protein